MKKIIDYSKLTENQLINKIKKDGNDLATKELIHRHENIIYSQINKFCRRNPYIKINDLLEDKYLILNNAIINFNPRKKIKFSTFLYHTCRWHCLNTNKKKDLTVILENSDIDLINSNNNKFIAHSEDYTDSYNFIFSILDKLQDKRILKIYKMRYFEGEGHKLKKWKDIAKSLNLSIPRVITLHDNTKKLLLSKIKSENINDLI